VSSVEYELAGDVAVVTLNRSAVYNAVDRALAADLLTALRRAATESRALVLTGAGKAFCSGADLADLAADYQKGGPDLAAVIEERFNPCIEALLAVPLPTVAAVNGAAAGAGLGLALAADLRVGTEAAFFMSAFIQVGLIPDSGTTWLLPAMVGLSRAREMAATGRRVGAQEAFDLGLLHRLVPADRLLSEALELAAQLADGPSHAFLATRRALLAGAASSLPEAFAYERRVQGELGTHPAHLEGVRAFLEKRKADFRLG